jgi:hypothetical protein
MTNDIDREDNTLSSSLKDDGIESDFLKPLLPRSAWNSQVAFLRVMFKAKKALDKIDNRIEREQNTH